VRQRVVEAFSSVPSLRPGLFYDLSTGDSYPLRIPPTSRGLRFLPLISREKHGGLPTVTQKRSQSHTLSISATGVSPWVSTFKELKSYIFCNSLAMLKDHTLVLHIFKYLNCYHFLNC